MSGFAVGEVAVFWDPGQVWHLAEVTILSELQFGAIEYCGTEIVVSHYEVDVAGIPPDENWDYCAPAHMLRKHRPPPDWVSLCNLDEVPADQVPA